MRQDGAAAGWAVSQGRTGYPEAVAAMKARAAFAFIASTASG